MLHLEISEAKFRGNSQGPCAHGVLVISSPRRSAGPFRHRRSGQGGDGQGYALKTFHVNIQNVSQRQVKSWNEKTAYSLEKTTMSFWTTKCPPPGKLSWQMETRLFPTKDSICHLFTDFFPQPRDFFSQSDGNANLDLPEI